MDPTTTEATPPDGVAAATQPVEGTLQPAAPPQEPPQSQPAPTDDTAAWLQSKGVDPNDPEAFQKVAQMAYHSEKQMTKATQEASELKKSLTPQVTPTQDGADPMMSEFIQDYRRDKLIGSFKESHSDWDKHEPAMVQKLNEQVQTPYGVYTRSQLVNSGFLSLEDVYLMAKASAPVDTTQIQTQAKQEVLQTLANTQRAGGGNAQASNSNPQASTEDPITAAIRKARG
jgi:hypothetical protein